MAKLNRKNRRLKWTISDLEYLKDNYGLVSTAYIAKKLGRTTLGVQKKAREVFSGMKRHEVQCLYSLPEICKAFGVPMSVVLENWVHKRDMPTIKHKAKLTYNYAVDIDKFWEWLESSKDNVTISMDKVNLDILEHYPEWFLEDMKAKRDYKTKRDYSTKNRKIWTKEEVKKLEDLYYTQNKSAKEIAMILDRPTGSVSRKISREAQKKLTKTA